MTEQQANEVMIFIEHLEVSPYRSETVLKHLYDLHQLRDQKLCDELVYSRVQTQGVYNRLYDMQTWYY